MKAVDKDRLPIWLLHQLLDYVPATGEFFWRLSRGGLKKGAQAGSTRNDGYIRIMINGNQYLAHRLAWAHYHGAWPNDKIDHERGKSNKISNLREATQQQNMYNFSGRKSLPKGVFKCHDKKYQVVIRYLDQSIYIGRFKTINEANEHYVAAAEFVQGNFRYDKSVVRKQVYDKVVGILKHKTSGQYTKWERI